MTESTLNRGGQHPKLAEIRDTLARETGVASGDVEKILTRLEVQRLLETRGENLTVQSLRIVDGQHM